MSLAKAVLAVCAPACVAAGGSATASVVPSITLVCTVDQTGGAKARFPSQQVCDRFARNLAATNNAEIVQRRAVPTQAGAKWIRADIAIKPRGRIEARVASRLNGRQIDHPLMALQVMDKALEMREIEQLARQAAKQVLAADRP